MIKQSTARNYMVFMTDSADHVSGKTGLTLTIYLSKNGAAPAAITPTVTEVSSANQPGWYNLALTTAHTDTLGDFVMRITGTGADPSDIREEVVVALPGENVTVGAIGSNVITAASIAASALNGKGDWNIGKTGYSLTATTGLGNQTANITGSVTSVTNAVTVGTINSNVITAASIAAAALNGKGDWNIGKTGYTLTQAFPTNFSSLAITVGGAVTVGTNSDKTGYSLTATTGLGNQTANITGSITSVTNAVTLPSIPANWITAAGINAAALNGKGDWNIGKTGYSLTATTGLGNQTANIAGSITSVTNAVTVGTNNDKTGYSLTAGTGLGNQTADITGNLSGSVGSVTGLTAANLDVAVSTRLATAGYTAPDNATLTLVEKILRNKKITDPSTGIMTVYDNDGTTPLLTAQVYEDAGGTQTYRGQGAERTNRLA